MRESQPTYRLTVDDAPAPTLVFDTSSREIVDANQPACALYGYDRTAFLALRIDDLRPARDVESLLERLKHTSPDEVAHHEGVRHVRSDGTPFYVSLETHPFRVGERSLRMVIVHSAGTGTRPEQVTARHALLFRGIQDAVIFTDHHGTITDWNPAAEKLWGYSRAEVLGRTADFLHDLEAEGAAVVRSVLETLEAGSPWEGVLETVARDGSTRICESRVLAIHDVSGQIVGTVGINRDITRQRHAERALAESVEDFRILGDQIPHLLWVTDADGANQYINARMRQLTAQGLDDAAGSGWVQALHPDDRQTSVAAFRESVATGREYVQEHRMRLADGSYRWHVSRATPIRDKGGTILRWLGSSVDIHRQKTAQDRIGRREAYFRSVFENAHDAIVLFDEGSGRVVDANPQAESLYGLSRSALLRQSIEDLYTDVSSIGSYLDERSEDGFGTHLVTQESRVHGTLQVEVNAALMDHEDRQVLLTLNRDMTERRELERQLQQSQKMEAIGRLAGGLAHDFNNLTTAIQGFAAILTEELDVGGEAGEAIREIDRAADRASELTRQMLAYTRQQVMRGRVLDLNDVVRSSRQLIARLIGEDVRVVTRLADDLAPVRADPGQLDQVIMNLAVNARDAMSGGGRLTIATDNVTLDQEFADSHPPSEPGDYVRLRVADSGHGMDEETRAHAFEPFYTTKAVGEGTGLGLAMVYGIVKQSSGYIWVESEEGEGTIFDIYLPRVSGRAEAELEEPAPEVTPASSDAGETVLLVEDEAAVRKLAERVLERAGYRVLATGNGVEALELARTTDRTFDLVLTDMVMPEMSGKELVEQLGLTRPGTPVLYMSGYTGESLAERGDLTRTDVVLEKPFKPADLIEAVRKRLHDEVE